MDQRQGGTEPPFRKGNQPESLEKAMAETLEYGLMRRKDPDREAVQRLNPRYIVRIKAERDPILEETDLYREIAREVDDRYDDYLEAAGRGDNSGHE